MPNVAASPGRPDSVTLRRPEAVYERLLFGADFAIAARIDVQQLIFTFRLNITCPPFADRDARKDSPRLARVARCW